MEGGKARPISSRTPPPDSAFDVRRAIAQEFAAEFGGKLMDEDSAPSR
jgi:hypothetical protein